MHDNLINKSLTLDENALHNYVVEEQLKPVANNMYTINILSKLGTFTKSFQAFSPKYLFALLLHVAEGLMELTTCSGYQVDSWRFGEIPKPSFIWLCCICSRLCCFPPTYLVLDKGQLAEIVALLHTLHLMS